jgi:hypothetical protein
VPMGHRSYGDTDTVLGRISAPETPRAGLTPEWAERWTQPGGGRGMAALRGAVASCSPKRRAWDSERRGAGIPRGLARLELVPRAAHEVLVDKPAETYRLLRRFLGELD